jgi:hypothetical protein
MREKSAKCEGEIILGAAGWKWFECLTPICCIHTYFQHITTQQLSFIPPRIFHQPPRDACAAGAKCHFNFCTETFFSETAVEENASMFIIIARFFLPHSPPKTLQTSHALQIRSQPSRDACVAGRATPSWCLGRTVFLFYTLFTQPIWMHFKQIIKGLSTCLIIFYSPLVRAEKRTEKYWFDCINFQQSMNFIHTIKLYYIFLANFKFYA